MNHFEEKDNFVTILRGKKQSLNNFEAEKMQLAIIEQFQKKPLLYHFEKKKTIMEPFSGKQLILRKGKSCLY